MNVKMIRNLIKLVEESNIAELEVSRWGRKVKIIKNISDNHKLSTSVPAENIIITEKVNNIQEKSISETSISDTPAAKPSISDEQTKDHVIRSPMVGTFYRKPSPDSDLYVETGDRITPGKILCIIEAMKLMNEIEAEVSGTIVEILVDNGNPVEYNQPLFRVKEE